MNPFAQEELERLAYVPVCEADVADLEKVADEYDRKASQGLAEEAGFF